MECEKSRRRFGLTKAVRPLDCPIARNQSHSDKGSKGPVKRRASAAEYDSPWKKVLETFFRPALELCFCDIASQIDWNKGVEFLDKERMIKK